MAKLNQKDLSMSNIDDYIRQRVKSGAKSIIWGKNGLNVFNRYLASLVGEIHPIKIHGIQCFGIKHYIRNYKK